MPPTRRGYDPPEVVSALQKACRRSEVDEACYWAVELALSGYGAWCWKRLRTICSEDVGPAAPGLAADLRALYENWKQEQPKSGNLYLIHATIAVASAPKSRVVDWVALYHGSDRAERREIPDHALDKHTLRGKKMGRGIEHFVEEAAVLVQPGDAGFNLDEFEQQQRELCKHLVDGEPDYPANPFGGVAEQEHAHKGHTYPPLGQLRIEGDR